MLNPMFFLPGYNYSVIITLDDKGDKAVFAEDCVITLNGETVDIYDSGTNGFALFEYDFGEAESSDEDFSFSIVIGQIKEFFKKMYKVFAAFFGVIVF